MKLNVQQIGSILFINASFLIIFAVFVRGPKLDSNLEISTRDRSSWNLLKLTLNLVKCPFMCFLM